MATVLKTKSNFDPESKFSVAISYLSDNNKMNLMLKRMSTPLHGTGDLFQRFTTVRSLVINQARLSKV